MNRSDDTDKWDGRTFRVTVTRKMPIFFPCRVLAVSTRAGGRWDGTQGFWLVSDAVEDVDGLERTIRTVLRDRDTHIRDLPWYLHAGDVVIDESLGR